ncbi:hypothetical protein FrEUN1fDRAFT_6152 [Parafrankia sp. EUN1f]|nr:hypothetical protein FrEUN1fDRAFT_6152 [Parafrankia sp. EUN1f]
MRTSRFSSTGTPARKRSSAYAPGAAVETSYPHFGAFNPDERAIGYGIRAMAGWLAARAGIKR